MFMLPHDLNFTHTFKFNYEGTLSYNITLAISVDDVLYIHSEHIILISEIDDMVDRWYLDRNKYHATIYWHSDTLRVFVLPTKPLKPTIFAMNDMIEYMSTNGIEALPYIDRFPHLKCLLQSVDNRKLWVAINHAVSKQVQDIIDKGISRVGSG